MKTILHPNDGHQIKVLSACMYTQESEAISTSSETYGDRLGFERGLQSIARRENAGTVFFEICEAADQVNLNVGPAATPQTVLENYAPVRRTKPTTYVKAVIGLNSVVGCFLPMMAANCVKVVIAPATQIQFHAKRRGGI